MQRHIACYDATQAIQPPKFYFLLFKTLDSVMKVEMLEGLNAEEIKSIWFKYHEERSKLCNTLMVSLIFKFLKAFPLIAS
jgi:hypothetical protein